jgi:hypothetical protein
MATDQAVFMLDQSYRHDIENRQYDKAEAVRVGEAVELVQDEEAKGDKRNRIAHPE